MAVSRLDWATLPNELRSQILVDTRSHFKHTGCVSDHKYYTLSELSREFYDLIVQQLTTESGYIKVRIRIDEFEGLITLSTIKQEVSSLLESRIPPSVASQIPNHDLYISLDSSPEARQRGHNEIFSLRSRNVGKLSDFRSALLPLVIFLRDIEKPENLELNSQYHEDLVQQTCESGLMSADDRSCWLAVILAYVNSMYKISLGDGEAAYKAAITTLSLCSPVGNAAYQSLQQHHTSPQGSTRNEAPFLLAKLHLLALRKGNEAAKNRRRWGTTFEELTDILEELFERANGALLSFVALNGQDAYDVYTEVGKMFYHMSRIRLEIEETTDPVPDLQQSCLWFHAAKSIRNGTEGDAQRLFNEAKAELKQELRNEGLSTKRLKITPKYATMTVDNKQKERYPKIMQECWKEEHPHISLGRIRDYRHHTAPQGPDFPDPETFMSQWSTVPGQEQLVDDMDWQS